MALPAPSGLTSASARAARFRRSEASFLEMILLSTAATELLFARSNLGPITERNVPRVAQGRVERAVRAQLRGLHLTLADDGAAALAVALASQIDKARGAVAAAAAAAQLRMLLSDLEEKAARQPKVTRLDDIRARQGKGRAAASAS